MGTDTFNVNDRLALTVSGRYNVATVDLVDQLGTALSGSNRYQRFNWDDPIHGTGAVPRPRRRAGRHLRLGPDALRAAHLAAGIESRDRLQLIERIKSEDPKPPRAIDSRVARDLETIVLKAIEKEPARRYQNATELADDLRRFTEDQPILARKSSVLERIERGIAATGGRGPALGFTGRASSGLIGMTWLYRRADDETPARMRTSATPRRRWTT